MHDARPVSQSGASSKMLMCANPPTAPHLLAQLDHVESQPTFKPGPIAMPPTKRPKLSLQTTSLPVSYGTASTTTATHRTDPMATATPTTLNTFVNTFELAIRPSPSSATISPAIIQNKKARSLSPYCRERPYDINLPYGVKPILKSSSLAQEYRRGSISSTSSPRVQRKAFFPAPKKVSFRPVLEEEIVTQTYVAQHVDLSSSEDENTSSDGTYEEQEGEEKLDSESDNTKQSNQTKEVAETNTTDRDEVGIQRAKARRIEVDELSVVQRKGDKRRMTPTSRTKRKRRRWEWTLEVKEESKKDQREPDSDC